MFLTPIKYYLHLQLPYSRQSWSKITLHLLKSSSALSVLLSLIFTITTDKDISSDSTITTSYLFISIYPPPFPLPPH